ncbi:MAG: energy transducer TonB [Alphaproteobacteria bacterium]|nr:energy transducer TonB [Alphaproteobacteria bacterium]
MKAPALRARPPAGPVRLGLAMSLLAHAAVLAGLLAWGATRDRPRPPQTSVELMWEQPSDAGLVSEPETPSDTPEEPPAPPSVAAPPAPPPPPPPPMAAMPPPAPAPLALPPGPAPVTLPPPIEAPAPLLATPAPPATAPAPPEPRPPEPKPATSRVAQPELPAPTPSRPEPQQAAPQRPPARPAPPRPAARPAAPEAPPAATSGGGVVAQGVTSAPSLDPGFRNAQPPYPESARLMGQQGTVTVRITVGPDGRVQTVDVLQSPGFSTLEDAARRAALGLRFRPALRNGEPVQGQITTGYVFRLQ